MPSNHPIRKEIVIRRSIIVIFGKRVKEFIDIYCVYPSRMIRQITMEYIVKMKVVK